MNALNSICSCKMSSVRHINLEISAKPAFQLYVIGKKSIQPQIQENSHASRRHKRALARDWINGRHEKPLKMILLI